MPYDDDRVKRIISLPKLPMQEIFTLKLSDIVQGDGVWDGRPGFILGCFPLRPVPISVIRPVERWSLNFWCQDILASKKECESTVIQCWIWPAESRFTEPRCHSLALKLGSITCQLSYGGKPMRRSRSANRGSERRVSNFGSVLSA
jgi:hypothetical protein